MTPLAPVLPTPALAPADPQVRPTPAGAEASAAAPPQMGLAAVTAVQATKEISPEPGHRDDPQTPPDRAEALEPPADPPPVKGLGIPALHMAKVGDLDILDDPPAATEPEPPSETEAAPSAPEFSAALAATDDPPNPTVDLRR